MGRSVFYSWQSDRPAREGRNFIEKALETAVARIARDVNVEEAVRSGLELDKDTKNVPGSPPIFQTILTKIERASVFVADLTICGTCCGGTSTPNPNVLIEYGWALKSLGYFQVITVMNEAYGKPSAESLPFDLAHMRFPITYNVPDNASDSQRQTERNQLVQKLESAVRAVLGSEEFKAKLAKQPAPSLFPTRKPLVGRSRFRAKGKPLGFNRDLVARMIGTPDAEAVYLADGPTIWLRLAPSQPTNQTWRAQDLKRVCA